MDCCKSSTTSMDDVKIQMLNQQNLFPLFWIHHQFLYHRRFRLEPPFHLERFLEKKKTKQPPLTGWGGLEPRRREKANLPVVEIPVVELLMDLDLWEIARMLRCCLSPRHGVRGLLGIPAVLLGIRGASLTTCPLKDER